MKESHLKKVRLRKDLEEEKINLTVYCVTAGAKVQFPYHRRHEIMWAEQPVSLIGHFCNTLVRTDDGTVYVMQSTDLEPVT